MHLGSSFPEIAILEIVVLGDHMRLGAFVRQSSCLLPLGGIKLTVFKDAGLAMHVAIPMTVLGFSRSGQR